jgi:hypothetical protein
MHVGEFYCFNGLWIIFHVESRDDERANRAAPPPLYTVCTGTRYSPCESEMINVNEKEKYSAKFGN